MERASPDPDPALVAAAREVFERQLDGTHAAQTKAEWDPAWPETLFARAVHRALERILDYVGDPGCSDGPDAASAALDAAARYASDHPARTLIVERLRQMLHGTARHSITAMPLSLIFSSSERNSASLPCSTKWLSQVT